jgi:O-acetylserine/cysteine efflux transporter
MKSKLPFLLQGLFVVFLWSAQKVVMKMGLEQMPPYFFAGLLQLLVFIILLVYLWLGKKKFPILSSKDKYMIVLSGIVGDGAAILFVMIGLQYVTGATAGLIAATSVVFNLLMSGILIGERLKLGQYVGIATLLAGMVIFLGNQVLGGTLMGVALLLLAEAAYAFHVASNRMIAKAHKEDMALVTTLMGSGVGALLLVPVGLIADGIPRITWAFPLIIGIAAVALIAAFGELIWNGVLDKLQVIEVSILSNTMIIQVAILSVIFLHESLTAHNIYGGLLVLLGALIVDGRLIFPRIFGLKMV